MNPNIIATGLVADDAEVESTSPRNCFTITIEDTSFWRTNMTAQILCYYWLSNPRRFSYRAITTPHHEHDPLCCNSSSFHMNPNIIATGLVADDAEVFFILPYYVRA